MNLDMLIQNQPEEEIASDRHSHERLVVVADLLYVNVVLGVHVRLQGAITLRVTGGTAQQTCRILQLTLVVEARGGRASMAVTCLQDAGELLPVEL